MSQLFTDDELFGKPSSAGNLLTDEDLFGSGSASAKRESVPNATPLSVGQDVLSGTLQIAPTFIKGIADIGRMATGDRVGVALSNRMESDIKTIQNDYGSERGAAQRKNFQADMADENVNFVDAIRNNKGALADQVLPTLGSMILPVGVAGAAGKFAALGKAVQSMDKATIAARVLSAQKAAGIGTVAAQNASDTFAELVDRGVPMEDAYLGAGITVPFSVVAGKLTGGGAEQAITSALTRSAATKLGVKSLAKAAGQEGAQEMGEEIGQITGEAVATDEMPAANAVSKRLAVAGTLGAVMGGGANAATQTRDVFGKQQEVPAAAQPETPEVTAQTALEQPAPTVTTNDPARDPFERMAEISLISEQRELTPEEAGEYTQLVTQIESGEAYSENEVTQRTITAPDIKAAVQTAAQQYGPDAIITNHENTPDGVALTVAVPDQAGATPYSQQPNSEGVPLNQTPVALPLPPVRRLASGTAVVGDRSVNAIPSSVIAQHHETATDPSEKAALVEEMQRRGMDIPGNIAETAPSQPKTGTSTVRGNTTGTAARDDLVGAIMRVTGNKGISPAIAPDTTGDKAGAGNPKLRGLFLNGGTEDLGDVAELLRVEEGFDVRDGEHLSELIRNAAAGNVAKSNARVEEDAATEEEARHKNYYLKRANELGLKGIGGKRKLEHVVAQVDAKEAEINAKEEALSALEAREERAAIQSADIGTDIYQEGSRLTEADLMKWLGQQIEYTQDDIDEANSRAFEIASRRAEANAGYDSQREEEGSGTDGPGLGQTEGRARGATESGGQRPTQAQPDASAQEGGEGVGAEGLTLTGETNTEAAANAARTESDEVSKAQADRERDAVPFSLATESQPKPVGVQGGLKFSKSPGAPSRQFVTAPDGSIDFGEITENQSSVMRRQPGKIRLTIGIQNADGTGHGLVHIEANHGKQIRNAGFGSVEEFVSHVASSFGQVWGAPGVQLLATVRDGKQHMMYVELEQTVDKDGEYYRVNSAFPVRQEDYPERHGFKKLWDGSEPASAVTGEQPAFAGQSESSSGQTTPNARSQSDSNIQPTLEDIKSGWKDRGITANLFENKGVITLSRIVVPEGQRDQGIGTQAMQELVDYADANGKHIALSPSADFGGNKKRLIDFYKRFGFVENKGRNRAFSVSESMVRENPNATAPLYSFAGQSAATADTHALATAQQRLKDGEDAETVRKETGWFIGADGKPRFEIDDSQASLKKPYPNKGQRWGDVWKSQLPEGSTLGKMLDHPALFAAYPSLASIPVSTKKGTGASYSVESRQIDLGEDVPMYDVLSTLLHEIQHGIQTIEDFATGGRSQGMSAIESSPEYRKWNTARLAMPLNPSPAQVSATMDLYDKIPSKFDAYKRLAGEVEARNVQSRQNLTAEERRNQSPESTQDVANSDVIIVFNGKEMASAPMPANAAGYVAPITEQQATASITNILGKAGKLLMDAGQIVLVRTEEGLKNLPGAVAWSKSANDLQSNDGLSNESPVNRTIDATELAALRGAASRLERPQDGVFLRVTEDGRAIATGPKGTRIPDAFVRFAKDHDLAFEARRNGEGRKSNDVTVGKHITSKTEPMPPAYREAGALYFGEGNVYFDRTGKTRFAKDDGAIQGATLPDGRIVLVLENLTEDNIAGVLKHEGFHATIRALVGEETYQQIMAKLGAMRKAGNGAAWFKQALAAVPEGTAESDVNEEIGAYAIEQHENSEPQPLVIRNWVKSLLSALRTAIIKRMPAGKLKNWAIANITEQDMARLAVAGLRAKASRIEQAQGREAVAYSKGENPTDREFADTERAYGGREAYDKAKADGKTKLNYRQWVQVRTPKFKAWFGDWESFAILNAKPLASLNVSDAPNGGFKDVEKWAADLFAKQGGKAVRRGFGEVLLDHRATQTSMAHGGANKYKKIAFAAVKDVIERGALVMSKSDQQEDSFYFSAPIDIDGVVNIETVLVHRDPNTQRMYLHSVTTKENLLNQRVSSADTEVSGRSGSTSAGGISIVVQDLLKGNGVSKVVDPQTGEPMVVYHGSTRGGIAQSDQRRSFFTSSRDVARTYSEDDYDGSDGGNPTVQDAYLRIVDPVVANADGGQWMSIEYEGRNYTTDHLAVVSKQGKHDGAVIKNLEDNVGDESLPPSDIYITLGDKAQIKSATGNNGNFDGQNTDIRYSRASTAVKAKVDELTSPDAINTLIYNFQNKYIDLKNIKDRIIKMGGQITDLNDAYLGEETYHSKVMKRGKDFLANELKQLLQQLHNNTIKKEDFEQFLHARHAPERNAEMANRNPNQAMIDAGRTQADADVKALEVQLQSAMAKNLATKAIETALTKARAEKAKWHGAQAFQGTEDERNSLSGMSDAEAAQIMAAIPAGRRSTMNSAAAKVDAINAKTLDIQLASGLIDKASFDAIKKAYQFYVPLHRDEAHPDQSAHSIGQGFSVKGAGIQRATGSNAKVTNILGHIAMQREAQNTRAEKNSVVKRLYLMAAQNPLKDFWSIDKPPMIKTIDARTGFVRSGVDPMYKNKPNVVMVRIAGKDVAIVFNEQNPEAVRLAEALKNLDGQELNVVERTFGRATRWIASVNTQYNPIFGLINFARDVQGAMFNLTTTELKDHKAATWKETFRLFKEITKSGFQLDKMNAADRALWEDFQNNGGATGYRDMFANPEERTKALEKELKALDGGPVAKKFKAAVQWLSDYNESMENVVRLAAYKVSLQNGMSKERAASLAKNLTVNFNRKGAKAQKLGAYYAFFNASIQGSTRLAETLKGPAGRKIIAGGIALGVMQQMLGMMMMGGGDDDEWEKIPDFIKERSIVIPTSKDTYIAIPMPLGFNVIPNIGRLFAEWATGGSDKPTGAQLAKLAGTIIGGFNPIGGTDLWDAGFPTPLDPIVALLRNKDWTGKSIYREDMASLDPTPGFTRTKDSATPWAKGLAYAVNWSSGGTDYQPGRFSWTPDQIDYVIGTVTGGAGRELGKLAQTLAAITGISSDELPMHKVPLFGRVIGSTAGVSGQSGKFYENIRTLNGFEREIKGRAEAGEDVDEFLDSEPRAGLVGLANASEKQVKQLRKAQKLLKAEGDNAGAKEIDVTIAEVMKGLNMEMRQAAR